MKKLSFITVTSVLALIALIALPATSVFAAYEDGTYDVGFEIKDSGGTNTSIANGYFNKPAKLIVENGVNYVQLTVNNADYVKSINGPNGTAQVVSEDKANNLKTLKLQAGDVSKPVVLKMHIVVPEEVAGMEYDNHHTTQAVFEVDNIPAAGSGGGSASTDTGASNDTNTATGSEVVDNPPTGDSTPIGMYIVLLVGSLAVFAVYKFRFARN